MPHRSEAELRDRVRDANRRSQEFSQLFIAHDVGPLLDRIADARRMLRAGEWTEGETFDFCRECDGIEPTDWDRYAADVAKAEDPAWDGDREWIELFAKRHLRSPRGHAAGCALAALLAAGPDEPVPPPPPMGDI